LKGDMVRGRLHLLARYRTDRLHRELPKLITHLRASAVPVDWGLLLRDLALWDEERGRVAKQWVQQYHRTRDRIQRQRSNQTATADHSESETARTPPPTWTSTRCRLCPTPTSTATTSGCPRCSSTEGPNVPVCPARAGNEPYAT